MSITATTGAGYNPYRRADGKFTTRHGQEDTIAAAASAGDYEAYEREVLALAQGDAATGYRESLSAKAAVHPGLKNIEDELAQRDALIATGDLAGLHAFVEERVQRPEFTTMLAERDEARRQAKNLHEVHKFLEKTANANPDFDYEPVRQKGFELQNAYDELQVLKVQANEYKDVTAAAVAKIAELEEARQREAGTWREYTADTLNGLVETGEFESGSREWLELRKQGIGGSDVGKILGVYGRHYVEDREEYILTSKLSPVTDEEVAEQAAGHTTFTGAAGRGNAWEPHIFNRYSANHPEQRVTFCKTSWKNSEVEYQFANFDGLLTDEHGNPDGILEIKTASDASKWGDPAGGLGTPENPNVPPGYRAQVLWYCQAAGFKRGTIAVMIDDKEYREYPFTIGPAEEAEMAANRTRVGAFVRKLEARRADPNAVSPIAPPRKGFGPKILNAARTAFTGRSDVNRARSSNDAFGVAATWREESVAQTKARFEALCDDVKDEAKVAGAIRQLFTEKVPGSRKQNFVNIDLETSGATPTSGYIMEVGIDVRSPEGQQVGQYNSLFGLPRRMERIGAVGAVDVHKINVGMVSGRRQFSNPEVQKEILTQLKGGIMVAHNANFERRWLRQHLNGFAEAERRGEIRVLDTMRLTEWFLPKAPSNRLESMCGEFGVEYVDMHRAYKDASAMGRALTGLINRLSGESKIAA